MVMLRPSVLDLLMGEYKARFDTSKVVTENTPAPAVQMEKILMPKKTKAPSKRKQVEEVVRGSVSQYKDGKLVSSV